jgi:phytanoyl-CoA hydroxylase
MSGTNAAPRLEHENQPVTSPRSMGDVERYPEPEDAVAFRDFFMREGFIVVRGRIPALPCDAAVQAFQREVLPNRYAYFERHASGLYERHVYTEAGHMKYPIMNLQDISAWRYPLFRQRGLELLTQDAIQQAVQVLYGEPGRVIHTMYFDGNQETWAHRDGHYIDSHQPGSMIGVWVAAEDIHPAAGRFFVLPRSHTTPVPGEADNPNGEAYKAHMADFVRHGPHEWVAPVLRRGDFIMWSSLTIHGSLPTEDPTRSRRSFTTHYVPVSHDFAWKTHAGAMKRSLHVNGVQIALHRGIRHRLRNDLRDTFPGAYEAAQMIKARLSRPGT